MTLDVSPKNVYSFIVWNGIRNLHLRNQRASGLSLCELDRLIQSVVVFVEAQSRRSCCAFCAPARVCLSPCVVLSVFLHVTCTDDPHRLKCAIKSQVIPQLISQLISLSVHAVASLNKSLTYQCLRNLERIVTESQRKRKFAHGSGAVIQRRRTWRKS